MPSDTQREYSIHISPPILKPEFSCPDTEGASLWLPVKKGAGISDQTSKNQGTKRLIL
jgi:hypothetical protein